MSRFVPRLNVQVIVLEPLLELVELMYRSPSTPFTACSSGVVTALSTACAFAPVYSALIVTTGGAMRGYCAIGSVGIAMSPAIMTMSEQTAEKIGRLRKNCVTGPPQKQRA